VEIGTRLRKLRLERGLTQRELGAPRYTHAYVSTIEAGRRHPSRAALEHFAERLGVGVDELETGRSPDLETRLRLELQEARVAISEGDLEGAEDRLRRVTREARRIQDLRLEARAEELRGRWLLRHGDPEAAVERFQRAEDLLRDEPSTARADAVDGKAAAFTALGDVRYAIFLLESSLDAMEREGLRDPDALARTYAGLVYSYLDAGLLDRAAASASELERLAPAIEDPARIGQLHMNVARQYFTVGRIAEATASLQRAEDAYRHLGLITDAAGAALARGFVLARRGDLDGARNELESAVATFERTGDLGDLARAMNELAEVARSQDRPDEAIALLERSITVLGTADEPILAGSHLRLGQTLVGVDDDRAQKHLRESSEIYRRTEQPIGFAVATGALAAVFERLGEVATALDTYREAVSAVEPLL
jgi:tetratricopeptide (TPR) repeat protein